MQTLEDLMSAGDREARVSRWGLLAPNLVHEFEQSTLRAQKKLTADIENKYVRYLVAHFKPSTPPIPEGLSSNSYVPGEACGSDGRT